MKESENLRIKSVYEIKPFWADDNEIEENTTESTINITENIRKNDQCTSIILTPSDKG